MEFEYATAEIKNIISEMFPAIKIESIDIIEHGWDSVVANVNDSWIFKFPRDKRSEERLQFEYKILEFLQDKITLNIPQMWLHDWRGRVFSQHKKLAGHRLTRDDYQKLPDNQRNMLAATIAEFYSQMHVVPTVTARSVGAGATVEWLPVDVITKRVSPLLSPKLQSFLHETMEMYSLVEVAKQEYVFGYFDCHGDNMAFNHEKEKLDGLFDFADAGIDDFHKELHCTNWISTDLTLRIIEYYGDKTGRKVDITRVMLYSAVCRFSDLAEQVENYKKSLTLVEEWCDYMHKYCEN